MVTVSTIFFTSKNSKKKKKNIINDWISVITDNNQISILQWFLKDYVTLEIGVMTAKKSALPTQE